MRITVRFFALIRDRAGVPQIELNLPAEVSAANAVEAIGQQFPQLLPLLPRVACAVNQAYAHRDTMLHDGDELALIPPVSGG
jgi:molybdopterin converting factor subunit 1